MEGGEGRLGAYISHGGRGRRANDEGRNTIEQNDDEYIFLGRDLFKGQFFSGKRVGKIFCSRYSRFTRETPSTFSGVLPPVIAERYWGL